MNVTGVAFSNVWQGYGWCTMEETSWGDSEHRWVKPGQLFTKGPGTYKIPAFNDVPSDMRVKLMDRSNAFAVHSSKVIGKMLNSCVRSVSIQTRKKRCALFVSAFCWMTSSYSLL